MLIQGIEKIRIGQFPRRVTNFDALRFQRPDVPGLKQRPQWSSLGRDTISSPNNELCHRITISQISQLFTISPIAHQTACVPLKPLTPPNLFHFPNLSSNFGNCDLCGGCLGTPKSGPGAVFWVWLPEEAVQVLLS